MTTEWELRWELDLVRTAADQMATDAAMLSAVASGGVPILRLYQWRPPALTLGRNQNIADVDRDACQSLGIDVARRPTGGRALLHGADLTYAVAMPLPERRGSVLDAYIDVARGLQAGLAALGVTAVVARRDGDRGLACFASAEGADLAVDGAKLCGSAQVQRRNALLQHGAILLDRLPVTEVDVLRYPSEQQRAIERQRLIAATVTLAELGVVVGPDVVADAVTAGFASAFGVTFRVAAPAGDPVGAREQGGAPSLSS